MSRNDQVKGDRIMKTKKILVVDDDAAMRAMLTDYLVGQRHEVVPYGMAKAALGFLKERSDEIDLVISDIRMPEMDGMTFLAEVKKTAPELPVVLITAFGSIDAAVDAIRKGAFDYITKPFKLSEMSVTLQRALKFRSLQRDNLELKQRLASAFGMGKMLGKSPLMKQVFDLVHRVGGATANVLIHGESGTGKEMVARAIHESGSRKSGPFVAINCTAIPDTLLESELFGHAKGAFTGAIQRKKGLFEEAEGGTLFLDEIGDMDLSLQSKLLRVLQERKIKAVGDNQSRDINVRIVAATHKDLDVEVREGRFREDLFYRLSVIPVDVPALRERKEDIPLLVNHFVEKYARANHSRVRGFGKDALARLMDMKWNGNVRELENLVERLVVLSNSEWIAVDEIPLAEGSGSAESFFVSATEDLPSLEELEKRYIEVVLRHTVGRKDKASKILGINRRTLYRKEREYGFVNSEISDRPKLDMSSPQGLIPVSKGTGAQTHEGSSQVSH